MLPMGDTSRISTKLCCSKIIDGTQRNNLTYLFSLNDSSSHETWWPALVAKKERLVSPPMTGSSSSSLLEESEPACAPCVLPSSRFESKLFWTRIAHSWFFLYRFFQTISFTTGIKFPQPRLFDVNRFTADTGHNSVQFLLYPLKAFFIARKNKIFINFSIFPQFSPQSLRVEFQSSASRHYDAQRDIS